MVTRVEPIPPSLLELAAVAGVATAWVDAWGAPQEVAVDDLVAVLQALLDRRLASERDVVSATEDVIGSRPALEPVVVAWDGRLAPVAIAGTAAAASVELEDGTTIPASVTDGSIVVGQALPTGYHTLVVDGGRHTAHVLSAPMRAHPAPAGILGLISPTYSLRSDAVDVGIGTVRDLRSLGELCRDAGVAAVGTLPLVATFPDQPSPYAPASRRAWNELYVDLARVPDWAPDPMTPVGDPAWVDYDATGSMIRDELARYTTHVSATPLLRGRVDAFLASDPEMHRYARFRAMADHHGRNWRVWPSSVEPDPERVAYHETVQWLMDRQLRELSSDLSDRGQYLYLDLPIGCHPDGYDIWDHPELFAPASLGAPPDTLFVGGQDWGLPASIPDRSRAEGHANFRKAIARQLGVAGLLRIDHVMGIHRTWWVPHGRGARQGAYVMQPTDEMFAIICIESARAGSGVVGENLGTVPPEIRTGLDEHGLLGMAMAQDGVTEPRPNDLVALSSHDTPAFLAWWKAADVADLEELDVFDAERAAAEREARSAIIADLQAHFGTEGPEATRDALMRWMASTPAAVALLNIDDLLLEERRQNIPGTDWERPNWRLRHDRSIEQLAHDNHFMGVLAACVSARPAG